MPHRSWELRIADISEAIETALEYTAGMTFEQFVSDRKTIDAVISVVPRLRRGFISK